MTEHLNVAPEDLRRAASDHHAAAERLRGVPAGHADIMASLDSLCLLYTSDAADE